LGIPTTTGIEEKEIRSKSDNAIIEDEFTTSTTMEEEEGRTTIDQDLYTISNTTNKASNIAISYSTVRTTNTTDTNTIKDTHILPATTSNN